MSIRMVPLAGVFQKMNRIVRDMRKKLGKEVEFVIEGEGWSVQTYASALDFLAKDSPYIPGCVVLDVRMPDMSGLELQHEMKLRGNQLPIIFVSAHGDIDMAVKSVKDGALSDIAPTLLTLAGLDIPKEMTGKNLVEL